MLATQLGELLGGIALPAAFIGPGRASSAICSSSVVNVAACDRRADRPVLLPGEGHSVAPAPYFPPAPVASAGTLVSYAPALPGSR